jgi:hypothetical protein
MYGNSIVRKFQAIGARARVALIGLRFEIDIATDRYGDLFDLRVPRDGSVTVRVHDIEQQDRQLLLAAQSPMQQWGQKFLCGHDERDWFIAALPQEPEVTSVNEAFEALKPRAVLLEQEHKGIARQQRRRRHTAAYLRQGEWFFVPRPSLVVQPKCISHNSVLVRDHGTAHIVEWLYRPSGQSAIYARGSVSHPDHKTIRLEQWHQVFRNNEVEPVEQPASNRMQLAPLVQPWSVGFID